ncbi:MAG TPA: ABC transporter permease [Candidatus Cloacimonadota bacterium]|nr:ABC transporter permease [Candidatus Cloacimonadota bacterium]HPT72994.1 ABC transporter permease [Candidatus Cloacimonadota bacterium]
MRNRAVIDQYWRYVLPTSFLVILLFIWKAITQTGKIDKWILPSPNEIFSAFHNSFTLLMSHAAATLTETILGMIIAIILGILIASILEQITFLKYMIYPFLIISQTIPIISIAPLLIIWFGFGIKAKVFIVALVCFFPITINLLDGFRTIDPEQLKLLKTMGASSWKLFQKVKMPSSMPFLFSGLKIAATYSVMSAIIGEWLGAAKGLGIYMTRASHSYLTANVFAAILMIILMSFAFYLIIELLERILIPWHYYKEESYE